VADKGYHPRLFTKFVFFFDHRAVPLCRTRVKRP
jgi:hypothetical protein